MPIPTIDNINATAALAERGRLAVALFRLRDTIRTLDPADRERAGDALVLLLAECRDAAATGKRAEMAWPW